MDAESISKRLREAIPPEGISDFQREMERRGVRGASYAMVFRYLKGESVPPLPFLRVAAEVLGVRPAWLICGDGERTDAEAAVPHGSGGGRATQLERRLWTEAASKIAGRTDDPHAVAHALYSAVRRLCGAVRDYDGNDDTTVRLACALVEQVQRPLSRLAHVPPAPTARQLTNYYLAALHALMLAMPPWRSVENVGTILEKLEA